MLLQESTLQMDQSSKGQQRHPSNRSSRLLPSWQPQGHLQCPHQVSMLLLLEL